MSRSIKDSIRSIQAWVMQSESRIAKIAAGNGTPGDRAAPTRTTKNDQKIGARLDNGERFELDGQVYMRYKVQLNKGAENPTLKALADKNSHEVWSQADLPVGSGKDGVKKMFGDLLTNVKSP